jgi:hypothetical protein
VPEGSPSSVCDRIWVTLLMGSALKPEIPTGVEIIRHCQGLCQSLHDQPVSLWMEDGRADGGPPAMLASVREYLGFSTHPRNPGTTVFCDGVNCSLFSTRVRESRSPPPRVPDGPLMGGRVVSLSVDICVVPRIKRGRDELMRQREARPSPPVLKDYGLNND